MEKKIRILILEDIPDHAELIDFELRRAEIPFISKTVDTRIDFVRELHDFAPDVIISAYYLPAFTGLEALSIVQKKSLDIPFILIMGELGGEHADEILQRGASYVLKNKLSALPYIVLKALHEAEKKRDLKQHKCGQLCDE